MLSNKILKYILSILILSSLIFCNSRIAFSRPNSFIRTPSQLTGEDFNQNLDQRDPGDPGDSTPRDSPAAKWFANQNYSNNTFNFSFQKYFC